MGCMGRRLMVLLAWVASTVLAATVAWAAVGTVGHGPGATDAAVLSQREVATALAARQATASAAATADPTSPVGDPTPTPTPTPDPSATPTTPTATPTTPTTPPTEVPRTWAVDGGTVGATCRGPSISHDYATPADGWGVEVKNRGPEATEVEFESERGETKVTAVCVAGVPEMTLVGDGVEGGHDEGDD